MERNTNTLGPLKAIGKVLHTAGTTVGVIDNTVTRTGAVLDSTLGSINILADTASQGIEIAAKGWVEDMKTSEIVNEAYRKVDIHEATVKAAEIIASINAGKE